MNRASGHLLRLAVLALVLVGIITPIGAGLVETAMASLGYLPALGAAGLGLDPWRQLFSLPGVGTSIALTLWVGFASTLMALAIALGAVAWLHERLGPARGARLLVPLLATPHAALAIGLAFLIAPSGWLARLLSPWATGWVRPPDLAIVNDQMGLALILGLLIKEVPFFLLVSLAALSQVPVRQHVAAGRALGYGPGLVWVKLIAPQIYPLIRLPVYVVLAFALSVVDVAIILGPSNPPVLAVALTRWFLAADSSLISPASAGALLQTAIVIGGIALWRLAECGIRPVGLWWMRRGGRGISSEPGLLLADACFAALVILGAAALVGLFIWSIAWRWSFPQAVPESWNLDAWMRPGSGWGDAFHTTLLIGASSTALSLALAIAWLEGEDRNNLPRARWAEALIYLPLVVPQIGFLFGLSIVFLRLGVDGSVIAVIWGHTIFVFPYVMIALSDPWRAIDPRLVRVAASLGAGPLRRLIAVKVPVLLRPIMTAAGIGFAVSVAQYLPTLFLGAGRVATLTTEAVTLSSGSDRRVTGVYAILQATLPFLIYVAALALPAVLHHNRRGLSGGEA